MTTTQTDRNPDCRYCERYRRSCGRDHAANLDTRNWRGDPR